MILKNENAVDFINFKFIGYYLTSFAIVLLGGLAFKDIFALVIVAVILLFAIKRNLFCSIELWLIWFFSYGFYIAHSFIKVAAISKYFAKPSFLLFILFILFLPIIPKSLKKSKLTIVLILLSIVILISSIYHQQTIFAPISIVSFFLLYFLLSSRKFSLKQLNKLLNLFVAVSLFQNFICLLQVSQLIPPSQIVMDDGSGGTFISVAGLDDVACGTFGPIASHLVAWYVSLIGLLCIIFFFVLKKIKYILIAACSLAQFAMADSKTIMGVMFAMMSFFIFFYLPKNRTRFRINIKQLFLYTNVILLLGLGLLKGWNFYYEYSSKGSIAGGRSNLDEVYNNEINESSNFILADWRDWGKINGFRYVFNDFINEGNADLFLGYGVQGYTYNGKYGYILSKDTPLMQMNTITNSASGLISDFAILGLMGFSLLILSFFLWYLYINKNKYFNQTSFVCYSLVNIYLIFSIIAAFLYPISLIGITNISFCGLATILKNYGEYYKRLKIAPKNRICEFQDLY